MMRRVAKGIPPLMEGAGSNPFNMMRRGVKGVPPLMEGAGSSLFKMFMTHYKLDQAAAQRASAVGDHRGARQFFLSEARERHSANLMVEKPDHGHIKSEMFALRQSWQQHARAHSQPHVPQRFGPRQGHKNMPHFSRKNPW